MAGGGTAAAAAAQIGGGAACAVWGWGLGARRTVELLLLRLCLLQRRVKPPVLLEQLVDLALLLTQPARSSGCG
eukprot:3541026-Prymnesium_polylepis.1